MSGAKVLCLSLALTVYCADGLIVGGKGLSGILKKDTDSPEPVQEDLPSLLLTSTEEKAIGNVVQQLKGRADATASKSSLSFKDTRTQPQAPPSQIQTPGRHSALALYSMKLDPVLVRPNAGKGSEKIKYGLTVMNFYGAELKRHTFHVDMVMSLRWNDTRVIGLIPAGHEKMSMAWSQALDLVWMPGIVVTNRDIEMYEIVSASVTIFRTGEVLRVERAQAKCLNKFELSAYPFDTQHLKIKISSSKYMANEVALVPDKNVSAVKENIFGLYTMKHFEARSYETADGYLLKSRGVLDVEVKRGIKKYYEDHLVPSFILLTISWAVFYFPFATNPFITPRLALSILALLSFTTLLVKSSKELPGSAPFNWNDLFNQQIQTFMFLTIILNIGSEVAFHHFQEEQLARWINNEAKVIMPCLSAVNIIAILGGATSDYMTLETATHGSKASVFIVMGSYVFYISFGVYNRNFKKSPRRLSQGEGEADCDADAGDADCGM